MLSGLQPRFGSLNIDRSHVESFGPNAWPLDKRNDERFKTVDNFTKALNSHIEHREGHNPIDILDLHGIDVDVHGDHGYLSISFRDKQDPVRVWADRVMDGPTSSGDYEPLIAKIFARCVEALDNKIMHQGVKREKTHVLLAKQAREAADTGNFSKAGRLYQSAAFSLEGLARWEGKTVKQIQQFNRQVGRLFASAVSCQILAKQPYLAEINLRDAKQAYPDHPGLTWMKEKIEALKTE